MADAAPDVVFAQPSKAAERVELGAEIKHRLPALRALTSLRFFAAMHVVVYHLSAEHVYTTLPLLGRFVMSGYTGVALFFVLSGFILAYNYREVRDRRDFYISRFARVYPVYVIALMLGVAYAFAPASQHLSHFMLRLGLCLTLLHTWYPPFTDSFNGPGWTLSVEAFFYALFPFLAVWLKRFGDRALAAFCAVFVAGMSVPLAMHLASPARGFATAYYLNWGTVPPLHLPMFVIGVCLGIRYLKVMGERSAWPLWLGASGSLVLLCQGPGELYAPTRKALLVITYASLIYGLASVRRRWLTNRWMVLAGEISYSVYILQMPVMRTVLGVTRRLGWGFYPSTAAVMLLLTGISWVAYRFIELPARVAIRNRLTRMPVRLEKI
jgi:peptidoglycan/LPS O-acetylase OafA/YrhL